MLPTRNPQDSRRYDSFEEKAFRRIRTTGGKDLDNVDVDFKGWRCCTGMLAFLIASIILITGWHLKVISQIQPPAVRGHHGKHGAQHSQLPHHALQQHARSAPLCVPPETKPTTGGDALPALSERLGESKLLVFEVGADAEYWLASNCAGPTLFLQDQGTADSMEHQPRTVQMQTRFMKSDVLDATPELLDDAHLLTSLAMGRLPKEVSDVNNWDEILVESGGASNLNIFTARRLAGHGTTVFVDDCQQMERSAFVRRWFAQDGVDVSIYSNGRGGMMCKAGPGIPEFGSRISGDASNDSVASWHSVAVFAGLVAAYAAAMCWLRMSAMAQVGMKR